MKRLIPLALTLSIATAAHAKTDQEMMRPWDERAGLCRLAHTMEARKVGTKDFLGLLFRQYPHYSPAQQLLIRERCVMWEMGYRDARIAALADQLNPKGN